MEHRYLFIGDAYCGREETAWQPLADLLLCEYPKRRLQFHVHCGPRNTLQSLLRNCPRDIIGKQAGTIVLCVGYQDLRAGVPVEELAAQHRSLLHEIRSNSPARLVTTTLYAPESPSFALFNQAVRQAGRETLLDFEAIAGRYQELQQHRAEQQRNLLDAEERLTHLGEMLLARFMMNRLVPEIIAPDWNTDRN